MATLVRRQPAGIDFADWMSRLFDDRMLADRLGWPLGEKDLMRVEEFAEDGMLVVRAEMPGIDPEKDVEISMHDGMLHIRAERREVSEQKDKAGYRSEFRYGMFERTLPLPAGVSDTDVTATYKDGILEVRMPKAKEGQTATVPVVRLP
ncbi:MAG: Hsp20/alpha crystallin family protein [Mycobacteriales bacterium]